ncbi:uncharacterized protein [Littorina saxatilis]|uniref:uncharacterized protein n=1 Tax=Littorina saxatilis TaxID=31220 RepID=UPI0038B596DB
MSTLDDDVSSAPCGICDRPVTWDDRGVECESCGTWFHASCQLIGSQTYQSLATEDISWRCVICANANYSSTLFDLHGVEQEERNNSSIHSIPETTKDFDPIHSSTPTRNSNHGKEKNRPLRLLNINFQSASGKRATIPNLLESTKPDIVFGTETHLDPGISSSEFFPQTYKLFRKDRNSAGGGVFIAVKNDIQCADVPELNTDGELLWIKIPTYRQQPLYLCVFYRPDVSDANGLAHFETSIRRAAAMKNAQLLVAGDFNLPSYDWTNMTMKPKPRYAQLHKDFVDLLGDTGMEQVVKEPTRRDNTLDIVLTNCPSLIPRVEVIPGLSDHRIVYFEYTTRPETLKNVARPILLYQRANWEEMKQDMLDLQAEFRETEDTPTEDLWQRFKLALLDSMKKHIPTKTPRLKSSYPWITYEIKKIVRKRDRLYRKWKKSGNPEQDKEINSLNRKANHRPKTQS